MPTDPRVHEPKDKQRLSTIRPLRDGGYILTRGQEQSSPARTR